MYDNRNRSRKKKKRINKRRLAQLIRNVLLVVIITIVIACGFRVQAQASDLENAPTMRVYTTILVQPGDSLWGIAYDYCDSLDRRDIADYVSQLKELNHIDGANPLKPGASITIYEDIPTI